MKVRRDLILSIPCPLCGSTSSSVGADRGLSGKSQPNLLRDLEVMTDAQFISAYEVPTNRDEQSSLSNPEESNDLSCKLPSVDSMDNGDKSPLNPSSFFSLPNSPQTCPICDYKSTELSDVSTLEELIDLTKDDSEQLHKISDCEDQAMQPRAKPVSVRKWCNKLPHSASEEDTPPMDRCPSSCSQITNPCFEPMGMEKYGRHQNEGGYHSCSYPYYVPKYFDFSAPQTLEQARKYHNSRFAQSYPENSPERNGPFCPISYDSDFRKMQTAPYSMQPCEYLNSKYAHNQYNTVSTELQQREGSGYRAFNSRLGPYATSNSNSSYQRNHESLQHSSTSFRYEYREPLQSNDKSSYGFQHGRKYARQPWHSERSLRSIPKSSTPTKLTTKLWVKRPPRNLPSLPPLSRIQRRLVGLSSGHHVPSSGGEFKCSHCFYASPIYRSFACHVQHHHGMESVADFPEKYLVPETTLF